MKSYKTINLDIKTTKLPDLRVHFVFTIALVLFYFYSVMTPSVVRSFDITVKVIWYKVGDKLTVKHYYSRDLIFARVLKLS